PERPDVLFIPGYYTDAGLIARQARSLGLATTLLGADGWDSPKVGGVGGGAGLGERAPGSGGMGLSEARRDRGRGHGGRLFREPLLGGRSRARRAPVRGGLQGSLRRRARLDRGVLLRRDASAGRRDHARRLDRGKASPGGPGL